jgi:signal transduction histidine kinase
VQSPPAELAPGLGLSAYRIVQEALTNALKHAGRARASVRLRYDQGELDLQVHDDGNGVAAQLTEPDGHRHIGHGLVGMRERTALHGGRISAGPRRGGGFAVEARLPLRQRSDVDA